MTDHRNRSLYRYYAVTLINTFINILYIDTYSFNAAISIPQEFSIVLEKMRQLAIYQVDYRLNKRVYGTFTRLAKTKENNTPHKYTRRHNVCVTIPHTSTSTRSTYEKKKKQFRSHKIRIRFLSLSKHSYYDQV